VEIQSDAASCKRRARTPQARTHAWIDAHTLTRTQTHRHTHTHTHSHTHTHTHTHTHMHSLSLFLSRRNLVRDVLQNNNSTRRSIRLSMQRGSQRSCDGLKLVVSFVTLPLTLCLFQLKGRSANTVHHWADRTSRCLVVVSCRPGEPYCQPGVKVSASLASFARGCRSMTTWPPLP
jgi:hypothetical protein